jgi:hypothetical protein
MLNDTTVLSALHVHYTLFDVIPRRYHTAPCMQAYIPIIPCYAVCSCFGSAQLGKSRGFLNVQANFLCLQQMITVNLTLIITKRQMGNSRLPMYDKHKISIPPSRRAIRWQAQAACRPCTTGSTTHHPHRIRLACPC